MKVVSFDIRIGVTHSEGFSTVNPQYSVCTEALGKTPIYANLEGRIERRKRNGGRHLYLGASINNLKADLYCLTLVQEVRLINVEISRNEGKHVGGIPDVLE